ncbi:hypothetical protein CsatB_004892 [Cannabis sativa]
MIPFFSYYNKLLNILLFIFSFLITNSSPARIIPDQVTVITADIHNNATWRDFSRFLDAEKGSHVSGISHLKNYFHRFGYLTATTGAGAGHRNDDTFDSQLQSAIILYQRNLGLPVTGNLDSETIETIISPRCGVADSTATAVSAAVHKTRHYAYFYGKPRWERTPPLTLSYGFSPDATLKYLTGDEIRTVFRRAFSRWSAVIPVNFTEIEEYNSADIKIGFYRGDHGDGEPFDGVLGVLAHAFSPENGRFHLDAAESWSVDFNKEKSKSAIDLESVATHEIGHLLGLGHSKVKEAVMYPSLSPRIKKIDLKIDDVEGVQALYGSNPNFKLTSEGLLGALKAKLFDTNGDAKPTTKAAAAAAILFPVPLPHHQNQYNDGVLGHGEVQGEWSSSSNKLQPSTIITNHSNNNNSSSSSSSPSVLSINNSNLCIETEEMMMMMVDQYPSPSAVTYNKNDVDNHYQQQQIIDSASATFFGGYCNNSITNSNSNSNSTSVNSSWDPNSFMYLPQKFYNDNINNNKLN